MNKIFSASFEELPDMLQFILMEVKKAGFNEDLVFNIELALEEALVNIIQHGYSKQKGLIDLSCISLLEEGIKIIVKDTGIPYNPLERAEVIKTQVREEFPLGGYGIYLILKIMDEVHYQHAEGYNVLTLIKFLRN